jgi:mannose-6-phosphate isomerase-like protein (cupin superfamily)
MLASASEPALRQSAATHKPTAGVRQLPALKHSSSDTTISTRAHSSVFPVWLTQRRDFQAVFGYAAGGDDQLVRALETRSESRTASDAQIIAQYLAGNAFLAPLGPRIHAELAATVAFSRVTAGTHLIQQGETGSEFFIILEGAAVVDVDGQTYARISAGQCFGTLATYVSYVITCDPLLANIITLVR